MSVTVARVAELLVADGYRIRPQIVRIGVEAFRFDAVLEGPHDARGVVLVADGSTPAATLRRTLQTLLMSLEAAASTRPVTLVVVGEVHEEIERFCRVIRIGRELTDGDLGRALTTLRPLRLPDTRPATSRVAEVLRAQLGSEVDEPNVRVLLAAAEEGASSVESRLRHLLEQAVVARDGSNS